MTRGLVLSQKLQLTKVSDHAPSLQVFKGRVDGALSNLVQWKFMPMVGDMELRDP